MQQFVGMGVALVTPFNDDQSIDFDGLVRLVNFNIDNGTNYLVINGTTGESATITPKEKNQIIDTIVKTNNGINLNKDLKFTVDLTIKKNFTNLTKKI